MKKTFTLLICIILLSSLVLATTYTINPAGSPVASGGYGMRATVAPFTIDAGYQGPCQSFNITGYGNYTINYIEVVLNATATNAASAIRMGIFYDNTTNYPNTTNIAFSTTAAKETELGAANVGVTQRFNFTTAINYANGTRYWFCLFSNSTTGGNIRDWQTTADTSYNNGSCKWHDDGANTLTWTECPGPAKDATIHDIYFNISTTDLPPPLPTDYAKIDLSSRNPSDITANTPFLYSFYNFTYTYYNITNLTFASYKFNYTIDSLSGCLAFENGTCQVPEAYTKISPNQVLNNSGTGNSANVSYWLTENILFPHTENYEIFNSSIYALTNVTLSSTNSYQKEEFLNFSTNVSIIIFETPANTTGIMRIYIGNSSYTEGTSPATSSNVVEACTFTSTDAYNHTHTESGGLTYGHRLCTIQINNSKVLGTNLTITPTLYFFTRSVTGTTTIPAILNTTRTNSARITINNGVTYTNSNNQIGHAHFLSGTEVFYAQAWANYSNNGTVINSTLLTDTYQVDTAPPQPPTITSPFEGENKGALWNITYQWAGNVNYNISVLNSDLTFNKTLVQNNSPNLYYTWYVFNETDLYKGTYYIRVVASNVNGSAQDIEQVNITRNSVLNLTVKKAISNTTITTFNVTYTLNSDGTTTITYTNTTNNWAFLEGIRNANLTFNITSTNYSSQYNETNLTGKLNNYTSYIYRLNTFIINIYNEITHALIQPLAVSLDLISTAYSNNYTTTNGTFVIELLTPSDYTLRYGAVGFITRFYYVQLDEDTYHILNLYLSNTSYASNYNLTVSVVDDLARPYTNVVVKSLRYDLTTNTYIVQESKPVDTSGQASFIVSYNDEFWKFMVEDLSTGTLLKITEPSYIISPTLTIQISSGETYGTESTNYASLSGVLNFNSATNNFRLDYNDANGITENILLVTYKSINSTLVLYNTTNSSSASGTLLLGVAPVNGTTYVTYAYYKENGVYKYFTGLSYTYPATGVTVWGNMGLFAQILLTLGLSSLAFVSPVLGVVLSPLSIVIGAYIGWINFSATVLAGYLLTMGFILAIIISVKK